MSHETRFTVFLAGSTVELISALACITGLGISEAIIFVERNISFKTAAMDPLLASARARFPAVQFIELTIERPASENGPGGKGWNSFARRWQAARSIREQLDAACRKNFQTSLTAFGAGTHRVYFTALHDYVLGFLAACPSGTRVFYPHGFDQPRRQQIKDYPHLVCRRSAQTAIATLSSQRKEFGVGGLLLGAIGRLLPGTGTVSLPFSGVDQVLTFRSGIDYVPNAAMRVPGLAELFQWLLQLPPWSEILQNRRNNARGKSLLLLLSEYNRHPIWEENRNYGSAHLRLLQKVSQTTGLKQIVIKAHVRSDGSAAKWLAGFLKEQEQDWHIEILSLALSGLPVEALALTGEFGAACSLGSCSLPPGLGFGMPHYTSPEVSALFDEGWRGEPFSAKYAEGTRMLIAEGICLDVGHEAQQAANNVSYFSQRDRRQKHRESGSPD